MIRSRLIVAIALVWLLPYAQAQQPVNVKINGSDPAVVNASGQNVASPASEVLVGCQFNTSPTTVTTGNMSPCQMDNAGNLLVNIKTSATLTANATLSAETTKVIGTIRLLGNAGATLDVAASQNVAMPTNMVMTGGEFNTTPTTITNGNASPLQLDPLGQLTVTPGVTSSVTNGSARCVLSSAASTNATNCKNAAGNVYGFRFVNSTTTIYYLRMYNLSSSPTCSSATGFVETIPIPPAGAAGQAGGIVSIEPFGESYSTGIGFCFTGGSSSTDNTNAATGVFGTILYK